MSRQRTVEARRRGQRAIIAAEAWDAVGAGTKDESRAKKLARLFGVNNAYVSQARALLERAPQTAAMVKAGTADLRRAYEWLRTREESVLREELAATAMRLRTEGEGLSYAAIARELGVSVSYAHELVTDPDGGAARERRCRWEAEHRRSPCEACGEPCYGARCWVCSGTSHPMTGAEREGVSVRERERYLSDPDHPFRRTKSLAGGVA